MVRSYFARSKSDSSKILLSSLEDRIQNSGDLLIDREQDTPTENRSPQPHRSTAPKPSDSIISKDASEGIHGTSALSTLRPGLDSIERLSGISSDNPGNSSISEIRSRSLFDLTTLLEVLEDVVSTHAKCCSTGLLERRPSVSVVHARNAVLLVDHLHSVEG